MRLLLAGLLVLLPVAAGAQTCQEDAELGRLTEIAVEAAGSPAVAAVYLDAGDMRLGAAGVRARGETVEAEVCDLWHMGSNTKSMTAVLVARLAERGVISWDDTVGEVLGAALPEMDPGYAEVTYRHLLSHQSGLAPNIGMIDMIRFGAEGADADGRPLPEQRLDYAGIVLGQTPQRAPGGGFEYSNAGYVVAGAMMEVVTGEAWEDLVRREVFEPLGLESAGFGAPGSADALDQPRGHRGGLFGGLNAVPPGPRGDNPPVLGPAGTAHMSLPDLAAYLDAHMRGHRGEDGEFLSTESWRLLHTPPFGGDYAMGLGVGSDGRLGHAGSNTMWLVEFFIWPEEGRAFAYAFNEARIDRIRPHGRGILDALEGGSD